jgi:hypothetical protein
MDAALSTARAENSDPQQFSLGWRDFNAFVVGIHAHKTSQGSKPDWFYWHINVVQADEGTANSVLHVLGSRKIYTNPIIV